MSLADLKVWEGSSNSERPMKEFERPPPTILVTQTPAALRKVSVFSAKSKMREKKVNLN